MLSFIMLCVIVLSVIMLSVIMLSVIMQSVIMLSVNLLSDTILNVIMLSVIMLNVVAPKLKFLAGYLFREKHLVAPQNSNFFRNILEGFSRLFNYFPSLNKGPFKAFFWCQSSKYFLLRY